MFTVVRKEVKLFEIDETVADLYHEGERDIYVGITFQNLENYGYFEQPFKHSWKCKGGQTVWVKIENLPTPEQQKDYYCVESILRRQAFSAVAKAVLHGGQINDGFMKVPSVYWVSNTDADLD